MSFLVAFNGQFSPYLHAVVPGARNAVAPVDPPIKAHDIGDFKDLLHETEQNENPKKPLTVLKAYQQSNEKFEKQKKRHYARDIMSSSVQKISENATVEEAREIFQKFGFRHLPVVNDQLVIIGMISDREMNGVNGFKTCGEIMLQKVIVCEDSVSIPEIALILLNEKLNALPIVNGNREVCGIITLSDILRHVIQTSPYLGRA